MKYSPDHWCVLKMTVERTITYKVFATWHGGYLDSAHWKINSGITSVKNMENTTVSYFSGHSGSTYVCPHNRYGMNGYGVQVFNKLKKSVEEACSRGLQYKMEIMPFQDFAKISYE